MSFLIFNCFDGSSETTPFSIRKYTVIVFSSGFLYWYFSLNILRECHFFRVHFFSNSLFFNAFRQSLVASSSFLTSTSLFHKKDLCFAAKGYPSSQVSAAQQSPQRLSYISTTYWNGQDIIWPIWLWLPRYGGSQHLWKGLLSWCCQLQKQMEAVNSSPVGETMGKVRGGQALVYNRKCKWKHSVTVVCSGGPNWGQTTGKFFARYEDKRAA